MTRHPFDHPDLEDLKDLPDERGWPGCQSGWLQSGKPLESHILPTVSRTMGLFSTMCPPRSPQCTDSWIRCWEWFASDGGASDVRSVVSCTYVTAWKSTGPVNKVSFSLRARDIDTQSRERMQPTHHQTRQMTDGLNGHPRTRTLPPSSSVSVDNLEHRAAAASLESRPRASSGVPHGGRVCVSRGPQSRLGSCDLPSGRSCCLSRCESIERESSNVC